MLRSILGTILLLTFFIQNMPAHAAHAGGTGRFASPTGRFEAAFTELAHKKFPKREAMGLDEVDHVVYRINFYAKGAVAPAATISYNDVYGWEEGSVPAAPEAIFSFFAWSPQDDFVIIPAEGWASAPGTAIARAVALNRKLPWREAEFAFDNFVWTGDLSGVGDAHFDCDYSVSLFDGNKGQTVPIKASDSPIGYELISVEGNSLFLRETLDNCRTDDLEPRCFTLDLSTMEEAPRPCPVAEPPTN